MWFVNFVCQVGSNTFAGSHTKRHKSGRGGVIRKTTYVKLKRVCPKIGMVVYGIQVYE